MICTYNKFLGYENLLAEVKLRWRRFKLLYCINSTFIKPGKSYTGEGSGHFEKLEKPVWRPKGRQLNKFRSMLFTKMK